MMTRALKLQVLEEKITLENDKIKSFMTIFTFIFFSVETINIVTFQRLEIHPYSDSIM